MLEPTTISLEKTCSFSFLSALKRTGFFAALALLAGCVTAPRPVGITSPPPPVVGSAPISAYDDYARAMLTPLGTQGKAIAVIVPSPAKSPLVAGDSAEPQIFDATGAGI